MIKTWTSLGTRCVILLTRDCAKLGNTDELGPLSSRSLQSDMYVCVCVCARACMLMAKWTKRKDLKRGMAGLSLGIRGSKRRQTSSDWGVGGMERSFLEEVVFELSLEGWVEFQWAELVGRTCREWPRNTEVCVLWSPALLPPGSNTHPPPFWLLGFQEGRVPAKVGSHHPTPA